MLQNNWRWINLLDSFENRTSSKKIQQKDYLADGRIPVIDQGQKLIGGYTNEVDLKYDGELPIILFGDHTRCIKYIDFPFVQGADGVKVLEPKKFYLPKALFYILQTLNMPDLGYRRHFPLFKNYTIPLPPLEEQQRIVNVIENLFAKLDRAKVLAQSVVDNYELRRSVILYRAFTAQLTGSNLDDWQKCNLQSVCSMTITDGTHKTPIYCEPNEGIPFISSKDVKYGCIDWNHIKYIVPELHEELYKRLSPQLDDILLAKNGTTGVAAIVDVDKVFDIYVTLAVLRPNQNIIYPRYLLYIINSPICKQQFDSKLTGIAVPNLHLRDIKSVSINLPSMVEQKEIVRILDSLLAKEQRTKELAELTLRQIDLMKKAILMKAFNG